MQHHPSSPMAWQQQEQPPSCVRGLCRYKTGKCTNERAIKTNGHPHNLCNVHRIKQNLNQRKMDSKVRRKKSRSMATTSSSSSSSPRRPLPGPFTPQSRYAIEQSPLGNAMSSTLMRQPLVQYTQPRHHHDHDQKTPPGSFLHHHSTSPAPSTWHTDHANDDNMITVPTPLYLKGQEREAFRSRVLQKLLHILSEEAQPTQKCPPQGGYHHHSFSSYSQDHLPPTYQQHPHHELPYRRDLVEHQHYHDQPQARSPSPPYFHRDHNPWMQQTGGLKVHTSPFGGRYTSMLPPLSTLHATPADF
ncbi:hypothetical protein DYB37_011623 [Aphanomyces astaci]|uniref:Uncharacterized protein n=1 Tax=Aphanomyces astaci TaxID=112090 RepID=A0A3R6XSL6_APHAT|nr:hypothetical protein DYB35_010920 [Aphanomyces astaci]RHZ30699.1 hypothetical protein DYB37_011623 [Aphanomyces astaci]